MSIAETHGKDLRGPSDSICLGCGLCCDGTLLSHLAVSDESDLGAPLRALGVELIAAAEPPVFELPCPAVADGVCTIHHLHRPRACALFECDLSRRVLDGRLDATIARGIIEEVLDLRTRVERGDAGAEELRDRLRRDFRANI
ncbi:MAG: hypothetical protein EBX39_02100 [Actinobacteria bacterium]|nr:hypothetical protein [Actinomycetota bacterium]